MKHQSMAIALAAFLCLAACGKRENTSSQTNKPVTAMAAKSGGETVQEGAAASDVFSVQEGDIQRIRDTWRKQKIDGGMGDITPGITEFAFAFCGEYKDFAPNAALYTYLMMPGEYKEEETGFAINDKKNNGFVSAHGMGQYDTKTDCCYWNCDDGHQLLAFWLLDEHEDSSDQLVLFYDYDREEDILTPRPALTDMIEKAVKGYDSYAVNLPIQGKDIAIDTYTDAGDDSYETGSILLKWNGNGFVQKK